MSVITEHFRKSVSLRLALFNMSRAEFCRRSQEAGMECDQHWLHRILKTDNLRIRDVEHMALLLGISDGFFTLLGGSRGEGSHLSTVALMDAPIPGYLLKE